MPVSTSKQNNLKQSKIRYTEYYGLQNILDNLYSESSKNKVFSNLMEVITSKENIKLAYRNIKGNKGSHTAGIDGRTIKHLSKLSEEKYISLIQKQFKCYKARPVKRVEIPKPNGKKRPLGIPTIVDRIVQQCILQVLEPICEAKFNENSHGFRPNRSTEHAIAQCCRLMQIQHLHYVVDIDIQGFFDNVCHSKLIKQLWQLGIRDKKLLCIVKEMLSANIVMPTGEVITPTKGTPQGGILSPLLSNVVLNELDWWITSQWEAMPTHYPYKQGTNKQGTTIKSHTYRALRQSNLKEIYIVRYADDFKIFCRSYNNAKRAFYAVTGWLQDRLKLSISEEKSTITNLKQKYSEFLGFKLKVKPKGKKYVVSSHMSDKSLKNAKEKISKCVKAIKRPSNSKEQYKEIIQYNATVSGLHNYYCIATNVNLDFAKIAFDIKKQMKNKLDIKTNGIISKGFIKEKYGKSKQVRFLNGHPLIPVGYVQTKDAQHKRKSINKYTVEGRQLIHDNLKIDIDIMIWLMKNPVLGKSIEFADNRISLYAGQYGKCAISGEKLLPHDIHCHHKTPIKNGGNDSYNNLVLVTENIHRLIHATKQDTIQRYLKQVNLTSKQMEKCNKLRIQAGLFEI